MAGIQTTKPQISDKSRSSHSILFWSVLVDHLTVHLHVQPGQLRMYMYAYMNIWVAMYMYMYMYIQYMYV